MRCRLFSFDSAFLADVVREEERIRERPAIWPREGGRRDCRTLRTADVSRVDRADLASGKPCPRPMETAERSSSGRTDGADGNCGCAAAQGRGPGPAAPARL